MNCAAVKDLSGAAKPLPGRGKTASTGLKGGDRRRKCAISTPSPKGRTRCGTNIRNIASPHWRRWRVREQRCGVPFTAFSEPLNRPGERSRPVWFALGEDRPLAFFAGVWTQWTSVRKLKDGETTDNLYGFLTTEPNAEVGAVHPKAMPVILTTPDEVLTWLSAAPADLPRLQRPLPDGALQVIDPED